VVVFLLWDEDEGNKEQNGSRKRQVSARVRIRVRFVCGSDLTKNTRLSQWQRSDKWRGKKGAKQRYFCESEKNERSGTYCRATF